MDDFRPKTGFDKLIQISSVILIPMSIGIAGHLFGVQMKKAELNTLDAQFDKQHMLDVEKQNAEWRVTKSEVVYKFMDYLTSEDAFKREVAVGAIIIALPEEGPKIAEFIAKNDPDSKVKKTAINSLKKEIPIILNEMYSDLKNVRVDGTKKALTGWINNKEFITLILGKSISEIENNDGVWNTVVYLENNDLEILKTQKSQLMELRSKLEQVGNRNRTLLKLNRNILDKI